MADRTLRKAGRLSRLWPVRAAVLPPAPRPPVVTDAAEPLPSRGLTARELIAMARQARVIVEVRDPPQATDVFWTDTRFAGSLVVGLLAFILFVCPWMGLAGLMWLKAQRSRPL